jgi:hypothetical protein
MKFFKFILANVGVAAVSGIVMRLLGLDLMADIDMSRLQAGDIQSLSSGMSASTLLQIFLVQIAMVVFTYVLLRDFVFADNLQSGSTGIRFVVGSFGCLIAFGVSLGFFTVIGISVGNPLAVIMFMLLGLIIGMIAIFRIYDRWVFG